MPATVFEEVLQRQKEALESTPSVSSNTVITTDVGVRRVCSVSDPHRFINVMLCA